MHVCMCVHIKFLCVKIKSNYRVLFYFLPTQTGVIHSYIVAIYLLGLLQLKIPKGKKNNKAQSKILVSL